MVQGLAFLSKKSWHTKNLANQEKVWIAEQKQAAETSKTQELARQIQQEREQDELDKITGKKTLLDRGINWMYEHSVLKKEDEEKNNEQYLLGKEYNGDSNNKGIIGDLDVANVQEGVNAVISSAANINSSAAIAAAAAAPNPEQEQGNHYGGQESSTIADRNKAFSLRHEDPMFLVSQKQKERKVDADKKQALYHRVMGGGDGGVPTASSSSIIRRENRNKKDRHRDSDNDSHSDHDDDDDDSGSRSRHRSHRRRSSSRRHDHKKHKSSRKHRDRDREERKKRKKEKTKHYDSSSGEEDKDEHRSKKRRRRHYYDDDDGGDDSHRRRHHKNDSDCEYSRSATSRRHQKEKRKHSRYRSPSRSPSPSLSSRGRHYDDRRGKSSNDPRSHRPSNGSHQDYSNQHNNDHDRHRRHDNNNSVDGEDRRRTTTSRHNEGHNERHNNDSYEKRHHHHSNSDHNNNNSTNNKEEEEYAKKPPAHYGLQRKQQTEESSAANNNNDNNDFLSSELREKLNKKRQRINEEKQRIQQRKKLKYSNNDSDVPNKLSEKERLDAIREMQENAVQRHEDNRKYTKMNDEKNKEDDDHNKVKAATFLKDISAKAHGIMDTDDEKKEKRNLEQRLAQNRNTNQKLHELDNSFL